MNAFRFDAVEFRERAQARLCGRFRALAAKGKAPLFIATTIGRELLGFMWAIGRAVEPDAATGAAATTEARVAS